MSRVERTMNDCARLRIPSTFPPVRAPCPSRAIPVIARKLAALCSLLLPQCFRHERARCLGSNIKLLRSARERTAAKSCYGSPAYCGSCSGTYAMYPRFLLNPHLRNMRVPFTIYRSEIMCLTSSSLSGSQILIASSSRPGIPVTS